MHNGLMDNTTADEKFSGQHTASACQYESDWQSFLSYFQQPPADGQESPCAKPCPAFLQMAGELIRAKAQLAQLQQMHFGRSSEKGATVLGGPDKPEASSNGQGSCCKESDKAQGQKAEDLSQVEDLSGHEQDDDDTYETHENVTPIKSRRGGKPGHKGYGRHIPKNLATKEVYLYVPSRERFCKICGKEGKPLPLAFWEKSTQIDIALTAILYIFYRERLKFDCGCFDHCLPALMDSPSALSQTGDNEETIVQVAQEFPQTVDNDGTCQISVAQPLQTTTYGEVVPEQRLEGAAALGMPHAGAKVRFVTAPEPPQAVNKSKLTHGSIAFLIYLKYLLAIPLTRISTLLAAACGFSLAPSSMTCTFKHHKDLLEKLYKKMAEEAKTMGHGNIDETRWMSFFHRDGKESFMDWMWIFASEKVTLYVLDRSRSSKVLFKWLGSAFHGVITADRAVGYKKFAKSVAGVVLSFCWAHFRRDFVKAAVGNALLRPWAKRWIGRIFRIYQLNRERLQSLADPEAYAKAQAKLEAAVKKFFENIQAELSDPNLYPAQREVLECAVRHWAGLTVFVRDPLVPLDNNRAERLLRIVALARKNFYGTYAEWSGEFTAICLSILQTAVMHGLEPMAYIKYYLEVCAKAGGAPKDLDPYLPWNIPANVCQQHGMSKKELSQCA